MKTFVNYALREDLQRFTSQDISNFTKVNSSSLLSFFSLLSLCETISCYDFTFRALKAAKCNIFLIFLPVRRILN